jgi:hypothetical protein
MLLQLCQEGDKDLSVCVIEKGSQVGECTRMAAAEAAAAEAAAKRVSPCRRICSATSGQVMDVICPVIRQPGGIIKQYIPGGLMWSKRPAGSYMLLDNGCAPRSVDEC